MPRSSHGQINGGILVNPLNHQKSPDAPWVVHLGMNWTQVDVNRKLQNRQAFRTSADAWLQDARAFALLMQEVGKLGSRRAGLQSRRRRAARCRSAAFQEALRGRKRRIKSALLNRSCYVASETFYADEALAGVGSPSATQGVQRSRKT